MSSLIADEPASASLRPLFLWNTNHPASLEASVIAANSVSQTFIVTCASSCAPSEFPEQTITYFGQESWAGERNWDGERTTWDCDFWTGYYQGPIPESPGYCSASTALRGGVEGGFDDIAVDTCYELAHMVPAYVTGGLDKMHDVSSYFKGTVDANDFISLNSKELAASGCAVTTTEETTEAATTSPSTAGSTPGGSKSNLTAAGPSSQTGASTSKAAETASETGARASKESDEASTTRAAPTEVDGNGAFKTSANLALLVGSMLLGTWISV